MMVTPILEDTTNGPSVCFRADRRAPFPSMKDSVVIVQFRDRVMTGLLGKEMVYGGQAALPLYDSPSGRPLV